MEMLEGYVATNSRFAKFEGSISVALRTGCSFSHGDERAGRHLMNCVKLIKREGRYARIVVCGGITVFRTRRLNLFRWSTQFQINTSGESAIPT